MGSDIVVRDITNETDIERVRRYAQEYARSAEYRDKEIQDLRAERNKRRAEYGLYYFAMTLALIVSIAFAYFIYQHALAVV